MNPGDFEFISSLLKSRSGLVLTIDKSYLLESRLMPVARKHGLKGLDELVAAVREEREEVAEEIHAIEFAGGQKELFLASSGPVDVDGGEDPLVRDVPVQDQLHVPGSFELFEDDLVHAASGIDQSRGNDRQGAPSIDVPRGSEKTLGFV